LSGYGCGLGPALFEAGAPSLENVTAYETITEPGEIVYVPPYWGHCVEALEDSISVSVLSPSDEEIRYATIKWTQLPFGSNLTSSSERIIAAKVLLSRIISGLRSPKLEIEAFVDLLHHSRFLHVLLYSA